MAKDKGKHIQARAAFLHAAAKLLTEQQSPSPLSHGSTVAGQGAPAWYIAHLRVVSKRAQLRIPQTVKHATCKGCPTALVEGRSGTTYHENESKGGKKPWAEIKVIECSNCGLKKRFPVGAKRQLKKKLRTAVGDEAISKAAGG